MDHNIYSKKEVVNAYGLSRDIPSEVLSDYCKKIIVATSPRKLCDVGFGKGSTIIPFSMNSNVEVVGVDSSEKMSDYVKEELSSRELKAEIITADACLLPSLVKNIDILHMKAVTHIPENPYSFLTEISNAILDEGYFVIGKEYSQPEDNLENIQKYGELNKEDIILKDFYDMYFKLRKDKGKPFITPDMPAGDYDEAEKHLISGGFITEKEISSITWTKEITFLEIIEAIEKGTFTVFSKGLSKDERAFYAREMKEYCLDHNYDLGKIRPYKSQLKAIILRKRKQKTLITKKIEIDMAHRLPNHEGKCKNLHGHRYVIEVGVEGDVILGEERNDEGMVIDFGELKKILGRVIDEPFDHSLTLYDKDEFKNVFDELRKSGQNINYVSFVPTAENLAKYWFELLSPMLLDKKIKLKFVRVWETPTSTATYEN